MTNAPQSDFIKELTTISNALPEASLDLVRAVKAANHIGAISVVATLVELTDVLALVGKAVDRALTEAGGTVDHSDAMSELLELIPDPPPTPVYTETISRAEWAALDDDEG